MRLSPEAKQEEFHTFTARMWAESPTQAPNLTESFFQIGVEESSLESN